MKVNGIFINKGIFIYLFLYVLVLGVNFSFGQKHFYMEEKQLYEKFRLSNPIFIKGKEHFQKKKYEKAEKELKKCLEIMPEHTYAQFYLAHVLYIKKDFNKALEHIEKAKENYELMAELRTYSYQQYTDQLREQKDELNNQLLNLRDALPNTTDEQKKIKLQAQISQAENQIGIINNRLSEPVAKGYSIPADYFYLHGNIFFKLKRFQEAHDQYVEAIKADPHHTNAHNNLINIYFMAKQYKKAVDCINRAEAQGVKINIKLKKAVMDKFK